MLELRVESAEFFDEKNQEFINTKPITLRLEHSLVSLSKWESKWKVPFLSTKEMTLEQSIDYIRCMTMNQNVDPLVYRCLSNTHMQKVNEYISENRTATTFNEDRNSPPNRQIVTSELIYFWMAQYNIPMECQRWHLSRLLTLIRIASIKNAPEKKMSRNAILSRNAALNEARRKALKTKG